MDDKLIGSVWVLRNLSYWMLAFGLSILAVVVIPAGRLLFEGRWYNVARSSFPGDLFLIGCLVIASVILKREQTVAGSWMNSAPFHIGVALLSIGVGIASQRFSMAQHNGQFGEAMDAYHNLAIVPLFLYFLLTAAPVIFGHGTAAERIGAVACFLIWVCLVVYDLKTGRMDQKQWLALRA